MASGRPLFPGNSISDQLQRIFKVLGTPTEETWPKVSQLPEYKRDFEIFPKIQLETLLPKVDHLGIDLLKRLLEYPPEKRITASDALQRKSSYRCFRGNRLMSFTISVDPYFDELRKKESSSTTTNSTSDNVSKENSRWWPLHSTYNTNTHTQNIRYQTTLLTQTLPFFYYNKRWQILQPKNES